jgi:coproporphyrinogen III oxidase-like Fe-S oxidoreductase
MIYNSEPPKPMVITVKHHGKTLIAELPWDSSLDDIFQAIQGLLVADGYHNDGIENFIMERGEELRDFKESNNEDSTLP